MRYMSNRLNQFFTSKFGLFALSFSLLIGGAAFVFNSVSATSLSSFSGAHLIGVFQSAAEQEPNETAEQATAISLPGQATGAIQFGDAATVKYTYINGPEDKIEDFFKFEVPKGETKRVDIMLTFSNPAVDLDLFLYRIGNPAPLAVSNGSTLTSGTTERITPILTLGEGTYLVGVSAFDDEGNKASTTYTLSVTPDTAPPAPIITSLNPVSAIAGSGAFSLTVNGMYFIESQSVVRWGGNNRPTTFINTTQLVAFLTAADVATAGDAAVTVSNPPTLGGESSVMKFKVLPPGSAELEVEPNENSQQANLLLTPGKRSGKIAVGDASLRTINNDAVEDIYAVNLTKSARLDLLLTGTNPNAYLGLYLLTEAAVIDDSRTAGAVQRITTPAMLAPGRYLVGVSAINGSSDYTIDAKIPGDRLLQVMTSGAAPNSTATVPIQFYSEGDENRISFSLNFNPKVLSNPQVQPGGDVGAATLNVNTSQVAQGRIGVEIVLPQGQRLSEGVREVLKANFAINASAGSSSTPIGFTDQPVVRGIYDFTNNFVIGSYAAGSLILVPGFEADVSPRPTGSGDGRVTTADWTQVGRFAAGLDTPSDSSELQRADCAPKSTLGDGRLTIADWVLAGLFAAALESPVPAGGPTALVNTLANVEKSFESSAVPSDTEQTRTVLVKEATFQRGQDNELQIELVSQGNENAIGFSLNFDITQLAFVRATLGVDATGAIINVNTNRLTEGRLGVGLALPSGQTFAAGVRQIVRITFNVPQNSSVNSTTVSFGDIPIAREIADATANVLPATYTPGVITINPPVNFTPSLTSLDPSSVIVGGPSFTLTVNGTSFVDGAVVLANGVARVTQFVNSGQLRATIPAQDIVETEALSITVQNPPPGGGISNTLNIAVNNPVPTLTSLDPSSATVGGRGFTLAVAGANFVPGAVVQWNGVNRVTQFVNSTQLNAQILDSDIATVGTATVRVINPDPGGGPSPNTLEFRIDMPSPLPRIDNISPESVTAGNPGFTLTVNGSGFVASSVVRFNGNALPTTFVNNTQLTAQVSADNVANAGTASITVLTPAPGGGNSNSVLLTINQPPNPVPSIGALSPNPVTAGGPQFTLSISGSNFVSNSVARFNGQDRPTTFISATELSALISAADIQNGGAAGIRVFNPAPAGGLSNELTLTINFVAPAIVTLSPSQTVAGGPAFTLTVVGTNFAPGSVVRWNGAERPTTYVSVTELSAQIPASDIANVGTATVTVFSPPPGGGVSNGVTFTTTQAARPLPRITTISPESTLAGGPTFTLTVNGTNFVSDSVVRWNGSPRPTTFVGSTQLTAQISAADIATAGSASVTVFTPPAGGGESNSATFTITNPPNPVPAITTISPSVVNVGGAVFMLTVNGAGFTPSSVVRVNGNGGADRPTTFVSVNQLTAQISAADIATAGALTIRVFNPAPGGGTSNEVLLAVVNPTPAITSINPSVVAEGGTGFTLTVTGTGFVPGAEVRINGVRRVTTFVSNTQLTAQIPAADIAATGTLNVQVFNPEPGGGASNTVQLEVAKQNPLPRITTISPEVVNAAGPNFTLVVNGTGFVRGSVVRVNNVDRPTDFVSETALAAQVLASDIVAAGTLSISVFNPAPGGGRSNSVTLTINNPRPRITSISPDTTPAGSPGIAMIVNGEGFVPTSVVRLNGIDVTTTFITSSQLSAAIPAGFVTGGGTVPVTVFNPEPGGGTSNAATLTINNLAPVITGLSPDQVLAGSASFTLTINGARFVNGSVVRVNGQDRQTTFVNSGQLTVVIQTADIAAGGAVNMTVFNPEPGGGISNTAPLTVNNQTPALTSLSPSTVTPGSPVFTLTINGTGFIPGSVAQWNGSPRQTTFVSATQVTIQVAASDVASAGTATVSVVNPAPGGGASNALTFTISDLPNPTPTLTSLNPASIAAGSAAFPLTVNGTNFVPGAVVQWNGATRQTAFVSTTQLTAQIPAADVAAIGTASVTVLNPAPGGGASNVLTFTITPPNPVPTLTSLSPNTATVGSPSFPLTVNGTNFVQGAVVQWNGSARPTTFVSSTQLIAQVAVADVASLGSAIVTAVNPSPGGGTSNGLTFTITAIPNPTPTLASLSPVSATEGDEAFTLTVTGTNFVAGSTVRWNGSARPTIFVSSTQLTAQLSKTDVASPGTANVDVFNPAPGGGASNALVFTIDPLIVSCNTVCMRAAAYYSLNPTRWPRGSVLIGGVNFNRPVLVQTNPNVVAAALSGGTSPLDQLNQQYVATQLSVLASGIPTSSESLLNTRLRCYNLSFNATPLGNGATITINTLFGDLLEQARLAIVESRTDDMVKLASIFHLLNGDDPTGLCR